MMKNYDKAAWHIDGGEDVSKVVERFKEVFLFLAENGMLSEEGKETLEYGMDSSVVLNNMMVNRDGQAFLESCYDYVFSKNIMEIKKCLISEYKIFKGENIVL